MCFSKDDTRSASELSAAADSKRGANAPSAESLGAIMTLLDACLSTHHMPTLQDVVSEAQEKGLPQSPLDNVRMHKLHQSLDSILYDDSSSGTVRGQHTKTHVKYSSNDWLACLLTGKPQEPKQSRAQEPGVRWYDARARVALRRVAMWLQVPSSKLPVFECLLAQEAQVWAGTTLTCASFPSWPPSLLVIMHLTHAHDNLKSTYVSLPPCECQCEG